MKTVSDEEISNVEAERLTNRLITLKANENELKLSKFEWKFYFESQ